jgi:hypothetical protein
MTPLSFEEIESSSIGSKISFGRNQNQWNPFAKVSYFRIPLSFSGERTHVSIQRGCGTGRSKKTNFVFDIFETDGEIHGETDEDDIGFGVRQRP